MAGPLSNRRVTRPASLAALALLAGTAPAGAIGLAPPASIAACAAPGARVVGPDPYAIRLVPTPHANGAAGAIRLRFSASPFGLTVSRDGHHVYDLELSVRGLRPIPDRALVAWAATPELDQVKKLGVVDPEGGLKSQVAFNKFLVFVTAEPSADVERWSGPILLRGISRSGFMHTMAGHGPFEGEPC